MTHAGQHDVRIGSLTSLSPSRNFEILPSSSVPSSIIVRSAAKSVSNTLSKPRVRNAETILPVTRVPGSIPNSSPRAARTAGAVCTITVFVGSERALITFPVSSNGVRAPVGHTATHCPQNVHGESIRSCSKAGATTDMNPRLIALSAPTDCTVLQIVSQRRHIIHLSISLLRAGETSFL